MDPLIKALIHQGPASGTHLGCVPRINRDHFPTSVCSFVGTHKDELVPASVHDGSVQAVPGLGPNHIPDVEVLENQHFVLVDQSPRGLVKEVGALVVDLLVDLADDFLGSGSLWRALGLSGQLALGLGNALRGTREEPGIFHPGTVREHNERLTSEVYTDSAVTAGPFGRFWLLGREDDVPLIHFSLDGDSFDHGYSGNFSMKRDINKPNLGQAEAVLVQDSPVSVLRIAEAIVAPKPQEPRITRIFSSFDSLEKATKGKVNSFLHILQHLGVDVGEFWL